jgi:hypothetical protein
MGSDIVQIVIILAILSVLVKPVGTYMAAVFMGQNTVLDRVLDPVDNGGESTLTYFSQMFAIIFPQFTSAATGLACGIAFIRGLCGSTSLGNFYVDLTRAITRIMLPIAFVAAIVFVALYEVFKQLALEPGRVLTHRRLLSRVWGKPYENEVHYLRPVVTSLRKNWAPSSSAPNPASATACEPESGAPLRRIPSPGAGGRVGPGGPESAFRDHPGRSG